MKKIIVLLLVAMMFAAYGCGSATTSKAYTFSVETGDEIKIELDTSDGHKLSQEDGTFTVSKDDKDVLNGLFLTEEMKDYYVGIVTESEDIDVLSEGDVFTWLNGDEYVKLITLEGTDKTYVVVVTLVETEEDIALSDDAFDHLTISLE